MAYEFNHPASPEYHPNSIDGPTADPSQAYDFGEWDTKGSEIHREDVEPHAEDTDQVQATTLYREVLDDAARETCCQAALPKPESSETVLQAAHDPSAEGMAQHVDHDDRLGIHDHPRSPRDDRAVRNRDSRLPHRGRPGFEA